MPRMHTREFKLNVVRQLASGEKRPAQVCREYQLADGMLARWRKEYQQRGEDAFTPRAGVGSQEHEQRIAALERLCGQQTLEIAVLKKALQQSRSRSGTV